MKILVTGGAGFIGSVISAYFLDRGHEVRILDDLSTGNEFAIDERAEFIRGSILNYSDLHKALHQCEIVFHLAGKALVEESIHNPQIYMEVNREGTKKILEIMNVLGIYRIFFASTCSVYGNTYADSINEETDLDPINPYAKSKLEADKLIENYAKLDDFTGISFRFFNVSGAYFSKTQKWFGESHETETHLIPNLINWIEKGEFTIYGTDWDTADGTAIRDYVHVEDIAKAFYLAATNRMIYGNQIFNLGSELGYSIKQVIKTVEKVTNNKIKVVEGERRKGDPVKLVANSSKFKKLSGWYPESDLEKTIDDSIKYFNYKTSSKFQGK